MTYERKLNEDLRFGLESESGQRNKIGEYLGCELKKTEDEFSSTDFIDDDKKIMVELKTRRVYSHSYPSSMITPNKLIDMCEAIKIGFTAYVFIKFKDGLYCYDVKNNLIKREWIRDGGRRDRGRDEIKKYVYIPMDKFVKVC